MALSLTEQDTARFWGLYRTGRKSPEPRDEHFGMLMRILKLAVAEDLSALPLCPVADGLAAEEFQRRYRQVDDVLAKALSDQPNNSVLVKNYCWFLSQHEPLRALEIADGRLRHLAPDDAQTYRLIAELRAGIARASESEDKKREEYGRVVEALRMELSVRGNDPMALNYALLELAEAAYAANQADEARNAALRCLEMYAQRLGRPVPESVEPRVFHKAHIILGLLALDRDDASTASKHLLSSVCLPAEERDKVDYVALDLARRLLGEGAKAVVLEFVDRLSSICSSCDKPTVDAFRMSLVGSGQIKS